MFMNFKSFLLLFTLFAICSCNNNAAYDYSQKIVNMEKTLIPQIEQTESDVTKFVGDGKYDSIVVSAAKMETMINDKIDEIKKLPAPNAKGGEDFKTSCITYFEFLKSVYTSYKNFGSQTTDDAREQEKNKMISLIGNKEKMIADMQQAQKKFAKDNDFKIEDK